jgi:hypothetical protein
MRAIAYFESPHDLERASGEAERAGWRIVDVVSPAFDEQLLRIAGATRSPVATFVAIGGVTGMACGIGLTVGTVLQWPGLIVGGRPLVSVPPFLIVVFTLTVLFASIAAVCTFLMASARDRRRVDLPIDPDTTDNRFALLIESRAKTAEHAQMLFERTRAVRWRAA